MSTDVITMVLKSQNLSVDATISALLEMQKAALAAAAPKKSRLPSSYKKMEKYKMQLKQAVKEEKYRQAADIKEAIAELEKVINLDIADGHKVETLSVSINKDAKGKSGFDFKYHAGGWDVNAIHESPGQPMLQLGDRIIKAGTGELTGKQFKQQLEIWKKISSEHKKAFPATILRFIDASEVKKSTETKAAMEMKEKKGSESKGDKKADVKAPAEKHLTDAQKRKKMLSSLQSGSMPDDFLRPPIFFKSKGSVEYRSQMERDEQMARLLQDELFMEELRNNPDSFLGRNGRTTARTRQPARRNRNQPAAPTSNVPLDNKDKKEPPEGTAPTYKPNTTKKITFGQAARARLQRMAMFFKRKKKGDTYTSGRASEANDELVPLADQADLLPLAPDHAQGEDAFIIESDEDDLGIGPAVDSSVLEGKEHSTSKQDDTGAVSIDVPGEDEPTPALL
eukprot:CAMPEP_0167762270 /NCGR_PEP_ID=MMETSP0110_2-20121227/12670_1 /TAXON_ID=629695 /ORGANISM="Gymnochlora sp., Strain CCMP2014" /LENGTH=452 /DNA_ID=CAMNT_0007649117 /DNA_START=145 /DNA_END=1503 /DNA_ORIENTATION=+